MSPAARRTDRVGDGEWRGAVDAQARYKLATSDFLARGGDGLSALERARVLIGPDAAALLADHVIDYVKRARHRAPAREGRIVMWRLDVGEVAAIAERIQPRSHPMSGTARMAWAQAACTVLRSSEAMVIGPTPPGTGVMAPATSRLRWRSRHRRRSAPCRPPRCG
jgi:hypothetical protein